MTDIKQIIRSAIGSEFDGECHLSEAQALTAFDTIASLERRVEDLEGALKPFAERCDQSVRPDDSDNDGITVKTVHLRNARRALSKGTGQ